MIYDDNKQIVITAIWSLPLALCNNIETGPYSRVIRVALRKASGTYRVLPSGSHEMLSIARTMPVDVFRLGGI
jgi:hypothetical protein